MPDLTTGEWLFIIVSFMTVFSFIGLAFTWLYIRTEMKRLKEAIATIVAADPRLAEKITNLFNRKGGG
jgi:hypothetical protein